MSSFDSKLEPFFKSQTNVSSIKPCSIPKWYKDKIVAAKKTIEEMKVHEKEHSDYLLMK